MLILRALQRAGARLYGPRLRTRSIPYTRETVAVTPRMIRPWRQQDPQLGASDLKASTFPGEARHPRRMPRFQVTERPHKLIQSLLIQCGHVFPTGAAKQAPITS
jgi:hypothetical protein